MSETFYLLLAAVCSTIGSHQTVVIARDREGWPSIIFVMLAGGLCVVSAIAWIKLGQGFKP